MLVDTHCHLDMMLGFRENDQQLANIDMDTVKKTVQEATNAGVARLITIGVTPATNRFALRCAEEIPEVYCAIGLHPDGAQTGWQIQFSELEQLYAEKTSPKLVGVGETGLDFHHEGFDAQHQEALFRAHIEFAISKQLPLIIHTRKAFTKTIEIIKEYHSQHALHGVFHCFSEGIEDAKQVLDLSFLIGIGGPITYPKNDQLRSVVQYCTLTNVVLETDAPFLPPQHIRGKPNHPREITTIATYLGTLLGCGTEEVAHRTTENAERLFFKTIG